VAVVDLIAVSPNGGINVTTSAESKLADMYCKALLRKADPEEFTVCLFNGGAFKANIAAGNITTTSLEAAYPYPDSVVRLSISGNTLLSLLQYGVTGYPTEGWFSQVGNIRYSFRPMPNFQSETGFATDLVNAQISRNGTVYGVGGDDLNIILITSNYLAEGNDGYSQLPSQKVISNSTSTINDVVGAYIVKEKTVGEPVDNRIVDCSARGSDPFCVPAITNGGGSNGGGGGGATPASAAVKLGFHYFYSSAATVVSSCVWMMLFQ
jgi:2',3'-cyclic-nucleotide 2'-phosphodiesterase (5'-nucleotidase family)